MTPTPSPGVRRYHLCANTVVRASAGTGKTYTLVETVTHLLAGLTHHREPLRPAEIVAITFTEKAAGEMLERIRARVGQLAEATTAPDDPLVHSAHILEQVLPDAAFWRAVSREIDQLRVSTFHGFCLALLQQYPLEAGLDPSFGVYDDEGLGRRLTDLAELEVLAALDDPERRPAVEALLQRLSLRRRGRYGSGLAELLPSLLASVHEAGLELDELRGFAQASDDASAAAAEEARLALAVTDLLERLEARFTREKRRLGQVDFGDMQRLARNLLRDHPDLRAAVKQRVRTLLVDEFQDTNPIQRDLVLLLAEPPDEAGDWSHRPAPGAVPEGYRLGERRLFVVGDAKQAIYDFRGADVASFRVVEERVLAQGGLVDSLRTSYRSRPSLVAAANALFERALAARAGESEPWFVHWTEEAALVANRPALEAGPALHLVDSEHLCRARAQESGRTLRLEPQVELAGVAELVRSIVDGDEPWRVQDRAATDPGATRAARWGDVTILLRRFVRVLPLLLEQLDRRGIPYYVVKGTGFFAAREVADLSVALRAICASADAPALVAWLRGPMLGVSDEALARLAVRHGRVDRHVLRRIAANAEPLQLFAEADREALQLAARLLDELGRRGEAIGPALTLDHLLARTDFTAVLAALPQGEQALANVERVRLLAARDADRTGGSLAGFSRRLAALVEQEPPAEAAQVVEATDDVVRVMTIHQAKGLECPIAVVPDVDPGRTPPPPKLLFSPRHGLGVGTPPQDSVVPPRWGACRDEADSRQRAEQRRLMYVAVTRARDHVVLSGSAPLRKVKGSDGGARFELVAPPQGGGDWLHHLHALKRGDVDWLDVVPLDRLAATCTPARPPARAPAPLDLRARAEAVAAPRRRHDGQLVAAVTHLAELSICPRRYWLLWEAGLRPGLAAPELVSPPDGEPGHQADQPGWVAAPEALPANERAFGEVRWPVDPIDAGTLAHSVLERVDAGAWLRSPATRRREALEHLASSAGGRVEAPARDEVLARVEAALQGEIGLLLSRPLVERERAFVLHVPVSDDSGLTLRGQIDLLVPGDLAELPLIVDYKYSEPRGPLDAYAFQLCCYALAHHRRLGSPPSGEYRAGIAFLREDAPRVRELPAPLSARELEAFAEALKSLGEKLLEGRRTGAWPRLEEPERCAETRCRFIDLCWGESARQLVS